MRSFLIIGMLGSAWLTGGCYNPQEVKAFLREPRLPVAATEYRVYPPDVLHFSSLYIAEINDLEQMVRPDGKVNLPLVGELDVAGRTPREIEHLINEAATPYYSKTATTVEITKYESQRFYVLGEVERPGPLPWTGRDTLLDALAKTIPNRLAWPERVVVVRGDDPKTGGYAPRKMAERESGDYAVSGVRPERKDRPRKTLVVNMMAMVRSGDMSNNVLLMPEDVVYVQPNPLAALGLAIEQVLFPMRGASETLTYFRLGVDDIKWMRDGMPRDTSGSTLLLP